MKMALKRDRSLLVGLLLVLIIVMVYKQIPDGDLEKSPLLRSKQDANPVLPPGDENHTELIRDKKRMNSRTSDSVHSQWTCHKGVIGGNDWKPPNVSQSIRQLSQEDPELIRTICDDWLLPPSTTDRSLANPNRDHFSQNNQSRLIDELLHQKSDGFFIESGASNGEENSNSLFFEITRNWKGLLVEASPIRFKQLLNKHRHAYSVHACLSPEKKPSELPFLMGGSASSGIVEFLTESQKIGYGKRQNQQTVRIQCFPVFSLLQAIGVSHVDYFSLDIEGAELPVLKTLPLDKMSVSVFSIEYSMPGDPEGTKVKLQAIKDYLVTEHGYSVWRTDPIDVFLTKL